MMTKTLRRLALGILMGAFAVGGGSGCGVDKMPGAATGSGGSGSGGAAGAAAAGGGTTGQSQTTGLQFNGAITFVRVAR